VNEKSKADPSRRSVDPVIPDWARELRAALPEEGSVQVVILGRPATRYLELSRADIDASAAVTRQRRLRRRRRNRTIFKVRQTVAQRAAMGVLGAVSMLLIALGGVWLDRGHTERILNQERLASLDRELAFEAYIGATRHLLQLDNEEVRSKLSTLAIEPEEIFSVAAAGRIAGGNGADGGMFMALRSKIDGDHESLLLANLDLRDFLVSLPAVRPLSGGWISSSFGLRRHPIFRNMQHHDGVDFVTNGDPTIMASQTGVVTYAARNGGYGLTIEIMNDFGVVTRYAHLRQFLVEVGNPVQAGDPIGIMGSTGLSTGPHLHYEVLVNGIPVNPIQTLRMAQNALEEAVLTP
jgi:murein DD-endopeptidase MepM/ murein hydrolase activator NlpD